MFDIVERPVPSSDVPGEQAWPTQPIPVKPPPFSRVFFGKDEVTNISKEAHDFVANKLETLRHGPAFTPPSLQGSVVIPGFHGGATWSGASFDPTTGILYVNSNNVPNVTALVRKNNVKYPYDHAGYSRFLDENGYPAIKPPWGNLTAIDLNRGEFAWQIPLGEVPELTARGIPQTGTENFGGTIVTAGGLVFIGGTRDEKFHAFDKATGKLLWEYKLDAGGYATPCTYMVNGKQYVVIAAGGGGKLGTKPGDAFVAFALNERIE
jgi:quinoprotein glucose dehydrogenase